MPCLVVEKGAKDWRAGAARYAMRDAGAPFLTTKSCECGHSKTVHGRRTIYRLNGKYGFVGKCAFAGCACTNYQSETSKAAEPTTTRPPYANPI